MRYLFISLVALFSSPIFSQVVFVENIDDLRTSNNPKFGDELYIKGHSSIGDGGEGVFVFTSAEFLGNDDDGIVIKSHQNGNGKWVRQFSGHINVNYYGVQSGRSKNGKSVSETIQNIINYAANNGRYDENKKRKRSTFTKGNTIFFPNGEYMLDKPIVLKSGISIIGEGDNTLFSAARNANYDFMFVLDRGRISLHLDNFVINGNIGQNANVGGIHLKAQKTIDGKPGGLWSSTISNIEIVNINGHGIYFEGGNNLKGMYAAPNQFNTFQNVFIRRQNDTKQALLLEGQQTQNTFIECIFEGNRNTKNPPSKGPNVLINNKEGMTHVLSFINCGFGLSEKGIVIKQASEIVMDGCWFENLFNAVEVYKSIRVDVVNSRFANACGYGSKNPGYPTGNGNNGVCVKVENSTINIEKNYVLVTNHNSKEAHKAFFIKGNNNSAIVAKDNDFQDPRLSKTSGIIQHISLENATVTIDGKKRVLIKSNENNSELRVINSYVSGGEIVYISTDSSLTVFSALGNRGNINLGNNESITLNQGEWISFMKMDVTNEGTDAVYQLIK